MVLNIDPNVVYGVLVAIVLIVLILQAPRIIRARVRNSPEVTPEERDTQEWRVGEP